MSERTGVVRRVVRERRLRRLVGAFAVFSVLESATWLAMVVDAYERGGVRTAGTLTFVALGAAVLVAPFASYAGYRFRPEHAVSTGHAIQVVSMAVVGIGMVVDAALVVYAGVVLLACTSTFTRPLTRAVLPSVTKRPADLVAANVLVGSIEHAGVLVGPLLAAALLWTGAPWTVFAVGVALSAAAALATRGLAPEEDRADTEMPGISAATLRRQMLGGLVALHHERVVRVLVLLIAATSVVIGALDVLVVVVAEDRLGGGGSQAGVLAASIGLGTMLGAFGSASLIGTHRTTPHLLIGTTLLTVPLAALALEPGYALTATALVVLGLGQGLVAEAGMIALQRRAPREVLVRIFGVLEALQTLAMAVGAGVITILVGARDVPTAVVTLAVGLAVVLLAGTSWLRRCGGDVPTPDPTALARLRRDPIFEPLDPAVIERLAVDSEWITCASGTWIIREGDEGDRYFLVVSGHVDACHDDRVLRRIGPDGGFGEIALLFDVPRTASVRCDEEVDVLAIDRESFLTAVTGHPTSHAVARWVAEQRRD